MSKDERSYSKEFISAFIRNIPLIRNNEADGSNTAGNSQDLGAIATRMVKGFQTI
jgi:hypothetical protein